MLLAALWAGSLGGCVSRKLLLQSEPSGAAVILDGRRVGTTPWLGEFQSYGLRQLELELPGHARRIETIELAMPWWQYPGFDIVTDLVLPWTVDDHHHFAFDLTALDPEAGTWEDAHAAQLRMEALR